MQLCQLILASCIVQIRHTLTTLGQYRDTEQNIPEGTHIDAEWKIPAYTQHIV